MFVEVEILALIETCWAENNFFSVHLDSTIISEVCYDNIRSALECHLLIFLCHRNYGFQKTHHFMLSSRLFLLCSCVGDDCWCQESKWPFSHQKIHSAWVCCPVLIFGRYLFMAWLLIVNVLQYVRWLFPAYVMNPSIHGWNGLSEEWIILTVGLN